MKLDQDLASAVGAAVDVVNAEADSGPIDVARRFAAILERRGYVFGLGDDPIAPADVIASLPNLERLLRSDPHDLPEQINALLRQLAAPPELRVDRQGRWSLRAVPRRPGTIDEFVLDVVTGLACLVEATELDRFSTCADGRCDHIAFDLSRNRSRRFCSIACSNRHAVAAYRARRATK